MTSRQKRGGFLFAMGAVLGVVSENLSRNTKYLWMLINNTIAPAVFKIIAGKEGMLHKP